MQSQSLGRMGGDKAMMSWLRFVKAVVPSGNTIKNRPLTRVAGNFG
jgi:hypothetical protein